MNVNTSKEKSFYTQGQRFAARVLCIVWLLASGSPESVLAIPKRQPAMTPALTTSPGDHSLASTPPALPPGGILQLPPDSPGSFWGDSAGSSPSIDAALQERMSQEAVPSRGRGLLRIFPKINTVGEHLPFEARGGERVRFHYQMGQWRAEVSSHIGSASRRAVLPVVCSQGEDVASSLEVLSRYPSWYSQRQIHVLDRNVCPTLGEVVYVGGLGLKGGSGGEASANEAQINATTSVTQVLTSFQSLVSQERNGLLLQGTPKQPAEQSQPNRKRKASRELSPHSAAPSPQRASDPNPDHNGQSSTASLRPSTPPEQSREIATHPESFESFIALAAKEDEDCGVRRAAIEILVSQAQDAPNKAPAIISQLTEIAQDAHSDVRKEALKALGSVAAAVPGEAPNITPTLTEVAKNTSQLWNVRQAAIEALGVVASAASSEAPKIIPELLEFSRDKDKSVRAVAIKALAASIEALKSVDPDVATQACLEIVPVLLRSVNEDTDAYVRAATIKALETVIPVAPQQASEIIRTMIAAAKDKDNNVCLATIKALESVSRAATQDILNDEIIPTLIATAENSVRLAAIKALKSVYPTATQHVLNHEIIPTLIEAAKDSVLLVVIDALKSVSRAATQDILHHKIVPTLIEAAKDKDSVCLAALNSLKDLGSMDRFADPEEAKEIIRKMIAAAREGNADVQEAVLKTLGSRASIAPSAALAIIPELIENAKYQPRNMLAAAQELFAKATPKAPSEAENLIPQLIKYAKYAKRENWTVCEAAIHTLGAATPTMLSKHPEIIQSLIEATEHSGPSIPPAAIKALGSVAAADPLKAPTIIPKLIEVAEDQSELWGARSAAFAALAQLASTLSPEVVQNIIQILKDAANDRDALVQKHAIETLTQVASDLPQETLGIIPGLVKATKDKNPSVLTTAIKALVAVVSALPQEASGAIPTLIEVIQDHPRLRRVLKVIIQDQDENVRAAATEALGKIASNAPEEAPNIIQCLLIAAQDQDESIRAAAIKALGEMDPSVLQKIPEIIQHLLIATKDQEGSVRAAAIKALGKMNPDTFPEATSIIPALIEAAKKGKAYDRQAAIQALAKIAPAALSKATEVIPALIAAAQDQDKGVREVTIEALGKVTPTAPGEAPNIIPILIAAAQDQYKGAHEAATRALTKISIQQLLACYWAGPDPSLIPYITIRLLAIPIPTDNPPLQVWKSDTPQDLQVVLSATAGQRDVWTQPQEVVQCFTRRIRDEASQVEKGLGCYKQYLEVIPVQDLDLPTNVNWFICSVRQVHERAGRLQQTMQKYEQNP